MSLLNCISEMVGGFYESPRSFFGRKIKPQGFRVQEISEESQRVIIQFESGTSLYLHLWRFNHVIDLLIDKDGLVKIGSRIDPEKTDSVESSLYWFAVKNELSSARLRTAPFVCDLLVLCGYAEYGYLEGEHGKPVQAVKATNKLQ
jgi:hypothetical protein